MTASLEEYLKTIYVLYNKNGVARVTDIALEMNCSKPSVNRALKVLKEEEYIDYKAYGSINLTLKGEKQAKKIIRSQIAIESFLTDILKVNKNTAKQEAKIMRYAVSENTIKRFEEYVKKFIDINEKECSLYDPQNKKCINCKKRKKISS